MPAATDSAADRLRAFVENPPPSVRFEDGLSDAESNRVEQRFGFRFPPDLRAFLSFGLPASEGFPNWRSDAEDELERRLDLPADGICFDIGHNAFWYDPWGPRPDRLEDAWALARRRIAAAPTLMPVYGHRFIPAEPPESGNPVFSVVQADIIRFGDDLPSYLTNEFRDRRDAATATPSRQAARPVPFWDDLVMGRHRGGL